MTVIRADLADRIETAGTATLPAGGPRVTSAAAAAANTGNQTRAGGTNATEANGSGGQSQMNTGTSEENITRRSDCDYFFFICTYNNSYYRILFIHFISNLGLWPVSPTDEASNQGRKRKQIVQANTKKKKKD